MVLKKAIVLLNMGGARSKEELKEFIFNMFMDRRIISSPMRFLLAPLMRLFRTNKAWKNYEKIGGSSIYKYMDSLTKKLQKLLENEADVYYAMKYTKPTIGDIFNDKTYNEIVFFALYPQSSITTTLSSYDDVDIFFKDKCVKIIKVGYFFQDEEFNKTIINSIKSKYQPNQHLIFSAHGLPINIAKKESYEEQINLHIKILKEMLEKKSLLFKSITLAYQSKIGPMKWLKPSLDETLRGFDKGEKVLVYPISFVIDNSETDFELSIEYKHLADKIGLSYDVCKAQNDSDDFVKYLSDKIKNL